MLEKKSPEAGLEYIHNGLSYSSNNPHNSLYSVIVRDNYSNSNIAFFTPDSFSQQLGYLPHRAGNIIAPHLHKRSMREVLFTHEVLFVKKGKVEVYFYDEEKRFLGTEILYAGDVILLCGGGHGFKILEETVMLEVKQGPYMGVIDKERFQGVEK
jgi:hypothetical protein